jgi:nucleotide-binding universal stress UspA family protein
MSRILVAVSSPWASERMVEPLTGLAKRLGAEVLVVHVSRPSGGQMREQERPTARPPFPCCGKSSKSAA